MAFLLGEKGKVMRPSLRRLKASANPQIFDPEIREITLKPFYGLPYSLENLSVDDLIYERESKSETEKSNERRGTR